MRILVITPYFYPHAGGSQRYIEELYGALMRENPEIRVDVLTYNTEKAAVTEHYKGMTIYRIGCVELLDGQFAIPNYVALVQLLRRLKREGGYQVVNSHTRFFENSWWGWKVARYFGAVSVLTDHCAYHPIHSNILVRTLAAWVDHGVISWLGKVYDRVTVVSEATKHFLEQHGMRRSIEVVYGGVSVVPLVKRPHIGVRVAFIGRLIHSKNPELVLRVAHELVAKYPRIQFVFAGDGPLFPVLKEAESAQIRVVGQLNTQEIRELLAVTDMVVHPSIHHEGFPSVLLEAGAAGCAVIATARGGVSELIEQGKTGMVIEPTQVSLQTAIEQLLDNPVLRDRLGKNLYEKVRAGFNWKKIAQNYLSLIQ